MNPVNESSSDELWFNDTVEVFRPCPAFGPEDGGGDVVLIGRNFKNTALLTCRWTACLGLGKSSSRPRKCRDSDGKDFGHMSQVNIDLPAKYISPTRVSCPNPGYKFTPLANTTTSLGGCIVAPNPKSSGVMDVGYHDPVDLKTRWGVAIKCPSEEVVFGSCPFLPHPDAETKFNPCVAAEVKVAVSNDGLKFSDDGIDYRHSSITNADNHLDYTVPPTYALFTFVRSEYYNHTLLEKNARWGGWVGLVRRVGWVGWLVRVPRAPLINLVCHHPSPPPHHPVTSSARA